jgi:hypothetical protein
LLALWTLAARVLPQPLFGQATVQALFALAQAVRLPDMYSNQPLPFALSAIWFRVQSRECNAEAAEAATSRPSRPGTFFTSITPFRFARTGRSEAVLSGLCDEIANKANTRGWRDYRPLAPPSLPLRNEDQRQRPHRING